MKKVAVGGMLVGLAFIIAGAFWLAYRNSVENDIVADQTAVQSPVVKTDQEAPTAKQGAQDSPTEAAEGEAEAAANGDAAPPITKPRVAYTNEKGKMIGITRQGKEYSINPLWYGHDPRVDREAWLAAAAEPEGPPLSHDWTKASGPNKMVGPFVTDWRDPRTWESYRNFFGFDPPISRYDNTFPYRAMLDNWGDPIQWFESTEYVHRYARTTGFRPDPEQLERYLSLQADWKRALLDGRSDVAGNLRHQMRLLEASAQGEIPVSHSYGLSYYGELPETPEEDRAKTAEAIRDVYKRMGIEHLYDFYEKP